MIDSLEHLASSWQQLSNNELVIVLQHDQDERWQHGQKLLVEEYLNLFPQLWNDVECVLILILNEVQHREGQGYKFNKQEYLDRFPSVSDRLAMQLQFHSMCQAALPVAEEEETQTYSFQTTDEENQPGSTVLPPRDTNRTVGRFILRKELGQGSFGIVYQAFDPTLERDVALKVPKRTDQQDMVERFVREAKAAARLQHPNIVAVFDCSSEPGQSFIAMEWVEGVPLNKHVETYRPNHQQVAKWLRDLALALHAAHEQGIMHRDVKPANIMVDKQNRVRLMDFGLAKKRSIKPAPDDNHEAGGEQTQDGAIVGTPAYMSPEQAIGQMDHISFASDQFSLAVVGYELLTEKRPVTGKMMHLLDKLRDPSYQIVPLREQDKTIALGLEAILMKALQWKAVDRYVSLAEMALDLHRWLKGDEVQAPILKGTKNWKCPSCQRMNARSKTRCVYCKHHLSGGVPVDWTEQRVIPMTSRRIREEQDDNEPHFRVRFWEWTWIVLSLLMLGMIPWLQRSDRESLEAGRQFYALREVGQTLEQFMGTFGHLPNNIVDKMTGEPLLSWRVAILPFMERDDLYRKFHLDEPWDSEHNKLLLAEMPEIFNSSIGSTWFASSTQAEPYFTTIQGITGKDALFEAGKKNKYQNIFDGTSNTLAIAEARKAVPWTKPDDLVLTKDQIPELGKPGRGMFQAVMCDGSVYQFNSKAESDKLRGIMTIAGGEFVDLNHLAPQQRITIPRIFTRKLSEHEPYRPQTKFPSLRPSHWSEFSGWLTYGVTEHGQTIWLIVLILLLLILAKLTWVWDFYRRQQPARKAKS